MNRACAAKCRYRDNIRVAAFFCNMCFCRCGHGFIDQIVDAECGIHHCRTQRFRYGFQDSIFGSSFIQCHGAPQEIIRVQVPQHQICIGNGRICASLAITDRAGICTGALRSHLKQAHFADFCHAATTGTDFHQIDNGYLDGKTATLFKPLNPSDLESGYHAGLSFLYQTGFCRGTPHVKTEHVFDLEQTAIVLGCNHRSRRARFDNAYGEFSGGFDGCNSATG